MSELIKVLSIECKSCRDCPYMQYHPNYNVSYDSGYECEHPKQKNGSRLGDNEISRFEKSKGSISDPFLIFMQGHCPLPSK